MKINKRSLDTGELAERYSELRMVCEVWVAANEAKDQRIAELEEELARAQQRIARLSRMAGRRTADTRPARIKQAR